MTAITPASQILEQARAILGHEHGFPVLHAPRAAALLTRQALEQVVVELCAELGTDLTGANMRSRLIALRGLRGDAVADLAGLAWSGLSNCCHRHAYELNPTTSEVGHFIDQVTQLVTTAATGHHPEQASATDQS